MSAPEPVGLSVDPADSMTPDELRAEVKRLRLRIHEAVNECQQRNAPYVKRCDQFDAWSKWAREHFERLDDNTWSHGSEANRLLILSLTEERDALAARLAAVPRDDGLAARVEALAREAIDAIGTGGHGHWRRGGAGGTCDTCERLVAAQSDLNDRLRTLLAADGATGQEGT